MKDENGRLYKLLSERDFELRKLRKKLSGLPAGGIAAEAASSKIVDLSKKVREMTAELEAERSKVKQLAKKCFDLQNEVGQMSMMYVRGHLVFNQVIFQCIISK